MYHSEFLMFDIVFDMFKNKISAWKTSGLTYRSVLLQISSPVNLYVGFSFDVSWRSNFRSKEECCFLRTVGYLYADHNGMLEYNASL